MLGAEVYLTQTGYSIELGVMSAPMQINGPETNFAMASLYATFGAQTYPTPGAALSNIATAGSVQLGDSGTPGCPATTADLGHGVTATEYTSPGPCSASSLDWVEQGWPISIGTPSAQGSLNLARELVTYLADHRVPGPNGYITIGVGGDAGVSGITWQEGSNVLSVDGHASDILQDLTMASSMAPYPRSAGPPVRRLPSATPCS